MSILGQSFGQVEFCDAADSLASRVKRATNYWSAPNCLENGVNVEMDALPRATHSKRPLRVLFLSRTTLFSVPGGDTTQVMKTAEALRTRGCEVTVSTDIDPDPSGFD